MSHPRLSSVELHNEEVLKGEPDDIIIGHDWLAKPMPLVSTLNFYGSKHADKPDNKQKSSVDVECSDVLDAFHVDIHSRNV